MEIYVKFKNSLRVCLKWYRNCVRTFEFYSFRFLTFVKNYEYFHQIVWTSKWNHQLFCTLPCFDIIDVLSKAIWLFGFKLVASDSKRRLPCISSKSFYRISKTAGEKIAGQKHCLKNRFSNIIDKNHNQNFYKSFDETHKRRGPKQFVWLALVPFFCVYIIRLWADCDF